MLFAAMFLFGMGSIIYIVFLGFPQFVVKEDLKPLLKKIDFAVRWKHMNLLGKILTVMYEVSFYGGILLLVIGLMAKEFG